MAPNGHKSPKKHDVRDPRNVSQSWLESNGKIEYQAWQAENAIQMSFDEWKSSKHVDGLSLYYAALSIFNEPDSSVSHLF